MNIPTPHFLLREPKSKTSTLILCHIRFKNERIVFNTGERIIPTEWDSKKQRAINSKKFPQNTDLNIWLDKIDADIKSVFRTLNIENISATPIMIKARIDERVFNKVKNQSPTLLAFIESYIQESSKIKSNCTVKTYVTTYRHLKKYSRLNSITVDFDSIDLNFYNSFLAYLMHEAKLSQNTIGKHIQILKTLLNEATDRGFNKKLEFKSRKFKRPNEKVDSIYLNEDELNKIKSLDLSSQLKLERVRDLFLIGCYTGLRFSDFIRIRPENIKHELDGDFIHLVTQKTKTKVVIPLKPIVTNILNKYNGTIPKPMCNQKMNQYLKSIGEIAGINNPIQITKTKAGRREKIVSPKYMLIHTHTARKSFATNAFIARVPTISIMKITGHTTEVQFLRYVRISEEENATSLINHKFFNT